MPQPSRKHEKRNIPLSDQDVNLLYDIIRRADARASITQRPLAALWNTYDSISAVAGLNNELDKHYFDFLVNFSHSEFRGRPLLETFRALLREQNILLDDADGPQAQEAEKIDEQWESPGSHEDERRRPTRRVSLTSIYDTTREIERQLEPRSSSRASVSRLDIDRSTIPITDGSRRWTKEQLEKPILLLRDVVGSPLHNNRKAHNIEAGGSRAIISREHNRSTQQIGAIARSELSEDFSSESLATSSEADHQSNPSYQPQYVPEALYRPTKTSLLRDADAFNDHRETAQLHRILAQWRKKALDCVGTRYYLDYHAAERDRKLLLGQAVAAWRAEHHKRLQDVKTERLFEYLSKRADFARDLYLMGRVFSHWLVTSAQRVEETHVARRHLLRLKYFNTWRDITVIQELKAQRLGIKRPFKLMVRKYITVLEAQARAIQTYHHNLTKVVYFRWWWELCDKMAPKYRNRRLKKDALTCWSRKLGSRAQEYHDAAYSNDRQVTNKAFSTWAQKTRIDLGGNHQADGFQRSHLFKSTFSKWLCEARLRLLARQVDRMRQRRIARTVFDVYLQRTRMCIRANEVNDLRMKQNAWTAWNDQLRVNTLETQINGRIYSQAMYQWVLAQRAVLLARICDRRILKEAMQWLVVNIREKHLHLNQQEGIVARRRNRLLLSSSFERWRSQRNSQKEQEDMAVELRTTRSQEKCLHEMQDVLARIGAITIEAGHAEFYFLTTKTIKRWRSATVDSLKRRRQDAYARMRRQIKISLARRLFFAWQDRLAAIQDLNQRAFDARQSRVRGILFRHLDKWRTRVLLISQRSRDATERKSTNLLAESLQSWDERSKRNSSLEEKAARLYEIHMSAVCSTLLRRMSLRGFAIHYREVNRDATADAMRDRHWSKHFRNIFGHWRERAARETIADNDSPTARRAKQLLLGNEVPQGRVLTYQPSETHRVEEWAAFDDEPNAGDLDLNLSGSMRPPATLATMPAYLSTPSKRMARAQAVANISTTPGTPLRTPFAAKIRAEMRGMEEAQTAPPNSRREGISRSKLGQHVSSSN